jgi:hypothetical protein
MPDLAMPPPQVDMAAVTAMLAPILGQQLGGFPAQFFPQQSMFDQMRQMEQQRQMQSMMGAMSGQAQANFAKTLNGLGTTFGFEPTHPYRNVVAGDVGAAYPFLAQVLPRELLSPMWGAKGDPFFAAQDLRRAGRSWYDPATGGLGYSGLSTAAVTSHIYGDQAMNNTRIDQLSQFMAMQPEGFRGIRGSLGHADVDSMMRAKDAGRDPRSVLSSSALGKLSGNELAILGRKDLDSGQMVQQMDASRMSTWFKDQNEVFKSLKDLFGPNAAVPQLFQAMKDLTQNNAQGLSGPELAQTVRKTKELAEMSGLGVQGMAAMQGFLGSYAQSQGMSSRGVQQATHGAAAYRTAFEALGYGAPGLNKEQLTAMHGQLQVNAGNSAAAGQLGATLNVADAVGGFKAGSEADQLTKALRSGQSTYGPNNKSVYMRESEWRRIMQAGGADADTVQSMRLMTESNKQTAIDAGLDSTLRQVQFEHGIAPAMRKQIGMSLRKKLGDGAGAAADTTIKAIMDVDPHKFATDKEGTIQEIADAMRASGVTGSDAELHKMATLALGGFRQVAAVRGYGRQGGDAAANIKAAFDPKLLGATRTEDARAGLRGNLAAAFSGVGQDGVFSRFITQIQNAKPGTTPLDIAKGIFNIVPNEKMQQLLGEAFKPLEEGMGRLDQLMSDPQYFNAKTKQLTEAGRQMMGAEKKKLQEALPAAYEAYQKAMTEGGHPAAAPADGSKPLASAPTKLTLDGKLSLDGEEYDVSGTADLGGNC